MLQLGVDMAIGGVADDYIAGNRTNTVRVSDYGVTPIAVMSTEAMERYFNGSWAAWDKLYQARLFEAIWYPVGEINEDEAIVLQLLDQCERVCYTNEVFYHYMHRENSGSITTSAFSRKKLVWQKHCRDNLAFVREKYPQLEAAAAKRYRGSLLWTLSEIAMTPDAESYRADVAEMMAELKRNDKLFGSIPYDYKQDKIRYQVIMKLGFDLYGKFLRLKRGTAHLR